MKEILFIGNFLSKTRHTIGPIEGVMRFLNDTYSIKSASTYQNRFARLFDMVFKTLFFNYDIIHIDVYSTPNSHIYQLLTSYIANKRRKKIILNLHGGGLWELYSKNPNKVTILFARANKIVTPSRFLQRMFNDNGFGISYLPNNIDLINFPFVSGRNDEHKLLWIRAFEENYHPELAVKTLFYVKKTYKDAKLTMIGPDKGYLFKIKSLINQLGLNDSVNILGKISNNELYKFHHSHQVFLNTTRYESFGVAVLEAAACGIPIVSTNVGEIPYLWTNNENILLINNFDGEQMAKTVIKILADKYLAEKITNKAFEKAQLFNKEIIKCQWIQLFG